MTDNDLDLLRTLDETLVEFHENYLKPSKLVTLLGKLKLTRQGSNADIAIKGVAVRLENVIDTHLNSFTCGGSRDSDTDLITANDDDLPPTPEAA